MPKAFSETPLMKNPQPIGWVGIYFIRTDNSSSRKKASVTFTPPPGHLPHIRKPLTYLLSHVSLRISKIHRGSGRFFFSSLYSGFRMALRDDNNEWRVDEIECLLESVIATDRW